MSRTISAMAILAAVSAIVVGVAGQSNTLIDPVSTLSGDAVSREVTVRNYPAPPVVRDAVSRELTIDNRRSPATPRDAVSREFSLANVDFIQPLPRDAVSREISVRAIAPDLVPDAVNASLFGSLDSEFSLTWTVRNLGATTASGPWTDRVYVSLDAIPEPDEIVGGSSYIGHLPVGGTYGGSATFNLPSVPGDYWIIVEADGDNLIEEENDGNNRLNVSISVIQVDRPDLSVASTTFPVTAFTNQILNVAWTVSNVHEAASVFGSWVDRIYLSSDNNLDPLQDLDLSSGGVPRTGPLEAGGSYLATAKIRLPNNAGTYWLFAQTEATNLIAETDERNNALGQMVVLGAPDYTVANLAVSPVEFFMALQCDEPEVAICPPRPAVRIEGDAVTISNFNVRVPEAEVTVRLKHGNTRRVFLIKSDSAGHFVLDFQPLPLEAGSYLAVADHPAVEEPADDPRAIPFEIVGVQAQPAFASIGVTVGTSRAGQLALDNLGSQAVSLVGVVVEHLEGPTEIELTPGAVPTLLPPGLTILPFTVSASNGLPNSSSLAKFRLTPQVVVNGTTVNAPHQTLSVFAGPQLAKIVASVGRLDADMPLCELTLVEFDLWNEGSVPAEDVRILLPHTENCTTTDYCVDATDCLPPIRAWLTSVTPESLGEIAPAGPIVDETNKTRITLALYPTAIVPDVHSGGIAVEWVSGGQPASLALPFTFVAVTSETADVVVHAEDEQTYLCYDPVNPENCAHIDAETGGGPRITGASVVLKDSRGQVAFQSTTDASGTATIADVPLGIYLVEVSAANHGIYRATHEIRRAGSTAPRGLAAPNEVFAFLQSDYVTYDWTVTPIEFEDQYEVTIEAVFETFVPPPILTIEPNPIDLDLSVGEGAEVDLKVTNHGFLGAQNSRIEMPEVRGYLFESLVSDLGTIPGMSEVIVPVTINRTASRQVAGNDDPVCSTTIPVTYCYKCRNIWYCRQGRALVLLDNEECEGGTPGGGGICCPGGGGTVGAYGGGRGGGIVINHENLCIEQDPCVGDECESKPKKCRKGTQAKCCPEDEKKDDNGDTDPVYLHSGEFYEEVEDLRIRGRGLDFVWTRRYRSRLGENTPQGNGWDFSYNISLSRDQSNLILRDGQGRRDRFRPQPNNTWARDEYFAEIERSPDGTYTLHFAEGTKWNFHPLDTRVQSGKIASIEDPSGNSLRFDYDNQGRLTTIHDTLDLDDHTRDIVVTYNSDGFIESVSDFTGRSVHYEYYQNGEMGGSLGDLKSVAGPAITGTPTGNDFPTGKRTTYTYSKGFADDALNHNLLTITDGRRNDPNDPTFGDGPFLELFYGTETDPLHENYDRVVRQIWGGETVDLVYVRQVPSPGNHQSWMKTIVNDRMGNVSEYEFNRKNRLVRERHYTGRAIADQPTTQTQNRPRNKLRETDPNFFETLAEWNGDGVRTKTIHPDGGIEEFVYEVSLNPEASRRTRGNLRMSVRTPGLQQAPADQAEIVEHFQYDDEFGCSSCNSNYVTFKQDARGFATHRDYDDEGNLIHVEHADGGLEDFEYNAFGQMTVRVHPDNGTGHRRRDEYVYYGQDEGHQYGYLKQEIIDATGFRLTTTYEYDARGNVTRVIDPRGHDTLYTVNELDQIVRESSRPVTLANSAVVRYETDTYFDANNNVVRRDVQNIDHDGVLQSNSQLSTLYEFEVLNNLVSMSQELDESHFVVTEYDYDANRNRILTRYGEATAGRQPDNVIAFAYDERDMLFRETRGAGGVDASTTQYDYDPDGNMAFVRRGVESDQPRVTEHVFDGYHRMVESIDPMGNITAYEYDANGNRVRETMFGQLDDVEGDSDSVMLSDMRYVYDSMDRVIRTEHAFFDAETGVPLSGGHALGLAVNETDYSHDGRAIATIDDNGNQTLIDYDTANRRSTVTDAKGNTTTYQYDANSNVVAVVDVEKSDLGTPDEMFTTRTGYDELDRVVATIDNLGHTNRNQYDSRGNRTRTVDALNHVIVYVYDGLDRLLRTIRDMDGDGADPASTTNGMAEPDIVTAQTWDDSSRLTSQTDDNGNPTTYVYDGVGRKVAEIYADQTEKQWLFDVHDNNIFWTDANENEVSQTFDLGNRLIRRDVIPGPGVSDDTTFEVYKYDGMSRMTFAQDDDSIVTRGYDSLSRVTRETQQYMAEDPSVVRTFYDGAGNQQLLYYPDGRVIETTYDVLNRKKIIRDQGDAGYVAEYFYVGPSRMQRRNYGNNTRMDVSYDDARRTTRTRHTVVGPICSVDTDCPSGNTCELGTGTCIIDDRTYQWDGMYNKTQVADVRLSGPLETRDYTYDSVYRLIQSVRRDPTGELERILYMLDGVGNRMEVIGGPDAGLYVMDTTPGEPDDFRMNQYTITPFDRREYDVNGNLTEQLPLDDDQGGPGDIDMRDFASFQNCFGPDASSGVRCVSFDIDANNAIDLMDWRMLHPTLVDPLPSLVVNSWDYANRLGIASMIDSRSAYAYDALSRRLSKRSVDDLPSAQETFVSFLVQEIAEFVITGTGTTFVYGNYIDEILQSHGHSTIFAHADQLFSQSSLTSLDVSTRGRFSYGDFGTPIGPLDYYSSHLFTGRRYDREALLYHFRARYFDPKSGRFVGRDPIGAWGDSSGLGNGLSFVGNNPVSYLDPTGRWRTPSKAEAKWCVTHPECCCSVFSNEPEEEVTRENWRRYGRDENGTVENSVKHCAIVCSIGSLPDCSPSDGLGAGDAHEDPPWDRWGADTRMDEHNNAVGADEATRGNTVRECFDACERRARRRDTKWYRPRNDAGRGGLPADTNWPRFWPQPGPGS